MSTAYINEHESFPFCPAAEWKERRDDNERVHESGMDIKTLFCNTNLLSDSQTQRDTALDEHGGLNML